MTTKRQLRQELARRNVDIEKLDRSSNQLARNLASKNAEVISLEAQVGELKEQLSAEKELKAKADASNKHYRMVLRGLSVFASAAEDDALSVVEEGNDSQAAGVFVDPHWLDRRNAMNKLAKDLDLETMASRVIAQQIGGDQ